MGALTESSRLLGDAQVIEVQVVDFHILFYLYIFLFIHFVSLIITLCEVQVVDLHADRKEFDIKRASVHHQLDIVRANIQKKEVC